jgi:LytS/YehU family sensor histidine kinase
MLIPKMAIQTFAENALKHGILHLDRPGHLSIRIDSEMKMLVIRVEDDGIGRERAMKMASDSTGRGLSILKGYFDYYNRFNHEKIEFTITDLKDNNDEPCGTRILVKIPEGLTL